MTRTKNRPEDVTHCAANGCIELATWLLTLDPDAISPAQYYGYCTPHKEEFRQSAEKIKEDKGGMARFKKFWQRTHLTPIESTKELE